MAQEVLEEIRNAEAEGAELLQEAREEARRTTSDAHQEIADLMREAENRGKASAADLKRRVEAEAREVAAGVDSETTKQLDAMTKAARDRMQKAVDYIVDRVVS